MAVEPGRSVARVRALTLTVATRVQYTATEWAALNALKQACEGCPDALVRWDCRTKHALAALVARGFHTPGWRSQATPRRAGGQGTVTTRVTCIRRHELDEGWGVVGPGGATHPDSVDSYPVTATGARPPPSLVLHRDCVSCTGERRLVPNGAVDRAIHPADSRGSEAHCPIGIELSVPSTARDPEPEVRGYQRQGTSRGGNFVDTPWVGGARYRRRWATHSLATGDPHRTHRYFAMALGFASQLNDIAP